MDTVSFERVYDSFQKFHAFFAASFGRKQWRKHSRNYLQALLVQAQERRNAENLPESVGLSARAMQRFLTEARWSGDAVIGRLQEYLAPRLGHPEAVWLFDGSDFPKQGRKSAGVARQYCGRLGKVANSQAGMFLAYVSPLGVSPLGRTLVDKRLYLPGSWTSDPGRCAAAGVPEERRSYRSKTELALELLERALGLGHLRAGWVAGETPSGCRRPSGTDWRPWGCATCWTFREAPRCGPWSLLEPARKITRNIRGPDAPANPSCGMGSARPWSSAGAAQEQRRSSAVMRCRMGLGGR